VYTMTTMRGQARSSWAETAALSGVYEVLNPGDQSIEAKGADQAIGGSVVVDEHE